MMAVVVPPSTFIGRGTIARAGVIVAIFGGKLKATMITKGIACCTWEKKEKPTTQPTPESLSIDHGNPGDNAQ